MYQHYINLKQKEGFVNSILKGDDIDRAREVSENTFYVSEKKKKRFWFG